MLKKKSNNTQKPNQPKKKKRWLTKRTFWSLLSGLILLIIIGGFFFIQYVIDGLPSLEELENPKQKLASTVVSIDGEEIGQFFKQNRVPTQIDSIQPFVINALIATEDRKFYDHWGVDLERFMKAMFKTFFMFKKEGASTITQQLAKNLYSLKIRDENYFDTGVRKLREWITAVQIERTFTKREILEMYFNESYFGRGAYGIASASNIYFDKEVSELTVPEGAVFIGLLKSSVYYDPVRNYDNAFRRRNLVMYNMVQTGFLGQEEYNRYKVEPIELAEERISQGFKSTIAPHFVEYVRQQLDELSTEYGFDIYEDGLTIYTTLDTRMQKAANKAVDDHLPEFQKQFDKRWNWNRRDNKKILEDHITKAIKSTKAYKEALNVAARDSVEFRLRNDDAFIDSVKEASQTIEVGFVALDAHSGQIRAMVGSRDNEFAYGLNHVTQIRRQPGSSFKPVVYTVAIDNGLYPAYPMLNQPFEYPAGDGKVWSPQNFDHSTGGFVTLRDAIRESLNLVAARLIIEDYVPLWKVGQYAQRMGIKSRLDLVPAIALGTSEVTPLEHTSMYATLANRGIYNEPIGILRIEDKDGVVIDQFFPETQEAISEETAYIITDMLQDVINHGSGLRARSYFSGPAAGKTGTTQEYGDAWFMGYTPSLAAGTWVGFDDRRISFTGSYGQGARAALPIWAGFMKYVYEDEELELDASKESFPAPANGNVVPVNFCKETIFELGNPRLVSNDCRQGSVTDIIKLKDIPPTYNQRTDTSINIRERWLAVDSTAHRAVEIVD